FDVGVAVAFGLVGYVLRKLDFEPAPLVLAMILGPQLEASVRRALIFSRGAVFIFFERPISAVLMTLAVVMLLSAPARGAARRQLADHRLLPPLVSRLLRARPVITPRLRHRAGRECARGRSVCAEADVIARNSRSPPPHAETPRGRARGSL